MTKSSVHKFWGGIKAGLPVAIGYIPIAIAFGLLAKALGIPNYISALMSLIIYAGASQFIGINLLVAGASFGEIIIATFLLNLRHFLMTGTLSQRLEENVSGPWRALLAFGVTDETFSISALNKEETLSKYFILGLNTIAFAAWNAGTWLGLFVATGLPEVVKASMGIALYAMFIGLLVPHIKKEKPALVVAVLAVFINSVSYYLSSMLGFSGGWGIIIATVASAAIGAHIFAKGGEQP
jgi:4-azaleucine resistance transporter AzlC